MQENSDDEIIGRMIRDLRLERQMSQADFATLLRLPQSVISRIEHGERRMTLAELRLVCEFLETDLLEFVRLYLARVKP